MITPFRLSEDAGRHFNSVYNRYLFGICNGSFDYMTEMLDCDYPS